MYYVGSYSWAEDHFLSSLLPDAEGGMGHDELGVHLKGNPGLRSEQTMEDSDRECTMGFLQ
jgi:hypothetical protein